MNLTAPLSWQTTLQQMAEALGFARAGIASVPAPGSDEDLLERARYEAWVEAGRAGTMEYLKRRNEAGRLVRSSLREAVDWARSVVVCTTNYNRDLPYSIDPAPADAGWIARYAWSGHEGRPTDYHKVLLRRLEALRAQMAEQWGEFTARCYVDTGPVVERVYAQYAGLGWTGKNTCQINQEQGSWMLLGVILTSLEVPTEQVAMLAADRCGSCTRCLDACPTGALVAPRQMDASRCISYLTIEHRGPIPLELREGIGRQVFGCDICQDVCPWNRRRIVPERPDVEMAPRLELVNPAFGWLSELDEAAFGRYFFGSPIKRTRYQGFRRNLAIAMGNSEQEKFLPKLEAWAAESSSDFDAVVAEASRWAIERSRSRGQK